MGLFERVTPDGYPESSADYMDSNALLQRWHFMESMIEPLGRLVPRRLAHVAGPPPSYPPPTRNRADSPPPLPRTPPNASSTSPRCG